jgi:hypothetical protein
MDGVFRQRKRAVGALPDGAYSRILTNQFFLPQTIKLRALHSTWQAHFGPEDATAERLLSFPNAMQQCTSGDRDHHRTFN